MKIRHYILRQITLILLIFFSVFTIAQESSIKGSWSSYDMDLCKEQQATLSQSYLEAYEKITPLSQQLTLDDFTICLCEKLEESYDSYALALFFIEDLNKLYNYVDLPFCFKTKFEQLVEENPEKAIQENPKLFLSLIEKEEGTNNKIYLQACSRIVNHYMEEMNYPDAITIAREMIDISAKLFEKESLIYFHSVNKLALAYQYLKPDKALETYLEHDDLAEKILKGTLKEVGINSKDEYLIFKINMGLTYCKLLKYDDALYIYDELGKMQIDNNRTYLSLQGSIAEIKRSKGEAKEALSIILENLKNTESNFGKNDPDYISSLHTLAMTYMDLRNYEKSLECFLRAHKLSKTISSRFQYIYLLNNIGVLYILMENYEEALSCFKEYQQIQTERFKAYESSLNTDLRDYLFKDLLRVYYDIFLMIPSAFKDNKLIKEQYDHYCFLKGRELSQSKQLSLLVEGSSDDVLIRAYKEWVQKNKELADAYELSMEQMTHHGIDLNQLQNDADVLEMQLSSFRTMNKKYTFQDIKSSLEKDETYIDVVNISYKIPGTEYVFDTYYAYIIKRDALSPELISLHRGDTLELALEKYNSNINRRKRLSDVDWKYCFDHFWGKLEPYTRNMSTVYFSNAGVYNKINLNTLYDYKSDIFLNDKIHIVYSSNAEHFINQKRSLDLINERNKLNTDAVLIGNPTYLLDNEQIAKIEENSSTSYNDLLVSRAISRGELWNTLPGTQVEIDSISSILISNNWNVKLICRENAIESAVKKISSPTVLHIATHGFFSEDGQLTKRSGTIGVKDQAIKMSPLVNSALVFAGANNTGNGDILPSDNGYLNAYEASFLELRGTELVVLSACETGLGNVKNGKGVYGLQRAIQIAGAEAIIISMWKVSDNATQKLMRYFYGFWIEKGMNKRKAFNSAKLKLREEYSHPYFWGAFIFLGN